MKLTDHFTLEEFEYSATANAHGIDNHCPSSLIHYLRALCEVVLEPLRQHFNEPIIILSGYRSSELNRLVGGSKNSYHLQGRAADIPMVPAHLAYIRDHLPHKELINEGTWIHVAL